MMEDIHGNHLYSGCMAVGSDGKLFKLTNSHFKGISAMNSNWFKGLTRVSNVKSVVQKTTVKLKES